MSYITVENSNATLPPHHIAIIMDGNGRWAKLKGLPRFAGHRKGAQVVRKIVQTTAKLGVKYLTLFAFSSENWKRPEHEVSDLMSLLKFYVANELENLNNNNVRIRIIGDRFEFSQDIQDMLNESENTTKENNGLQLSLALNYGSRSEILKAVKDLVSNISVGNIQLESLNEEIFENFLYTSELPDPDFLIRTSGEQRLSNFLLWQLAYTELIFLDVLWPDFNEQLLINAIKEYQKRERRYGAATS